MESLTDPRQGWTSASNAQADALCPGRHLAQKGLPEEESTASAFGDATHEAWAGGSSDLTLTQERLLERAEEREKQVLAEYQVEPNQVDREIRLWAMFNGLKHSGQCDRLYLDSKRKLAVISDLKSLRGTVPESSQNLQLRDLAVLVWLNCEADTVLVFINQPLIGGSQQVTKYTTEQLAQSWSYMRNRITNSNNPESKRVAGEVQCKFCRARGTCPEALEWAESLMPVPMTVIPAEGWVRLIIPSDLVDVHRKAPTIIAILDAVKARLLEMPDDELAKLGLAKAEGFRRETITDNKELVKRLKAFKIKPAAITAAMKMTKAGLEPLVRAATNTKGAALEANLKIILDGITERKQDKPRLEWIRK